MKGDFSRDTFDPRKHYARVLMQQGRVQLDADWNEQTAILLHYLRTLARDVFGTAAGPAADCGFELITDQYPGIAARLSQSDFANVDDATKERWRKAVHDGDVLITPGRYYVQGILVESEGAVLYSEQSGLAPADAATPINTAGRLAYLDVWERHVTSIDDALMAEVALGGPDTCTRAQVVWRVRFLTPQQGGPALTCADAANLPALGSGKLRAKARRDDTQTELCVVSPESRYRGAENQLYRVEIHQSGDTATNAPTFKWSRDNGSVVFPIRTLTGTEVILEHLGRDQDQSLASGDCVELINDAIALSGEPGPLATVAEVTADDLRVKLTWCTGAPPPPTYTDDADESAAASHAYLRRWDHTPTATGALPITAYAGDGTKDSEWVELEDGVKVWFGTGSYRSGDYWLIPARVETGDVEWPTTGDGVNAIALDQLPRGPRHCYAPLALFSALGDPTDCRCRIAPLPCSTYGYAFGGVGIGGNNI